MYYHMKQIPEQLDANKNSSLGTWCLGQGNLVPTNFMKQDLPFSHPGIICYELFFLHLLSAKGYPRYNI